MLSKKEKYKTIILFCYEKNNGGESVITENIIEELNKNIQLKLIYKAAPPIQKTNLLSFLFWIVKNITNWFPVIWKFRKVDILYTTTFTAGFSGALLKRFLHYKIYFHYHGSRIPPKFINRGIYHAAGQYLKYQISFNLHKVFLKNCDIIIVPWKSAKKDLLRSFPFLRDKNITIIHNGIDLTKFKKITDEQKIVIRKKLGISSKTKIILNIGRINPGKNNLAVLKLFHKIQKNEKNYTLVISHPTINLESDKKYKLVLNQYILKNLRPQKVKWLSNYQNIPYLYNISDLVISLSKKEILPTTILEAFACGALIATTPVGAARHLLFKVNKNLLIKNTNTKKTASQIIKILNFPKKELDDISYKEIQASKFFDIRIMAIQLTSLFKAIGNTVR